MKGKRINRRYPEIPIVGVGAVIFRDGTALMVCRDQDPGRGQWSLPGGIVELGETLIDAIQRELREEVNIEVKIGGLIGVFDRIIEDANGRIQYHYIIVDYWGTILSGNPAAASDISEIRFVPLEELDNFPVHPEIKKTVRFASDQMDKGIHIPN